VLFAVIKKIDQGNVRDAPAGAVGLAVLVMEEDDRPVEAILELGGDDADDAAVPVGAAEDQALVLPVEPPLLDPAAGLVEDLLLGLLALGIELVELLTRASVSRGLRRRTVGRPGRSCPCGRRR